MSKILATYPSKSSLRTYDIIRGSDGVTYCQCWQWKLNRTCSHLKSFLNEQSDYVVSYATVNGKTETHLREAIAKAIAELGGSK